MNDINKQKFLAELARLLTFMYEEDRQQAMAAYTEMFDEAEDEQALLQALVSPIRQAVVVARAYNSTERKLQVHTQSREEPAPQAGEGTPEYMRVIAQIRVDALGAQAEREVVDEGQFSLFDAAAEEAAERAVELNDAPPSPPAEAEQPSLFDDEPAEPSAPEAADEEEKVDAFLADFTLPEEVAESESAETAEPAAEAVVEAVESAPTETPAPTAPTAPAAVPEAESPAPVETVRKPRVLLLILYVIVAIPVTVLGIGLLLIPTLVSLSLAAFLISVGILTLTSLFGGFAILADLLIVLGASVVLLALGLLFLWLFVWFIGGAIVGLVRGIIHLGGKWCYKEVPAV